MQAMTSRFGSVSIQADDILLFPNGLIGFEDCHHWILLADQHSEVVGWLQSLSHPQLAVPVVSPRRFLSDYRVVVTRSELAPLQLAEPDDAYVLAIVSKNDGRLTLNLKAPLVVNLSRHIGCQVITNDEQPVQFALADHSTHLRKSA
jgi:flagellar assembly factor FliW